MLSSNDANDFQDADLSKSVAKEEHLKASFLESIQKTNIRKEQDKRHRTSSIDKNEQDLVDLFEDIPKPYEIAAPTSEASCEGLKKVIEYQKIQITTPTPTSTSTAANRFVDKENKEISIKLCRAIALRYKYLPEEEPEYKVSQLKKLEKEEKPEHEIEHPDLKRMNSIRQGRRRDELHYDVFSTKPVPMTTEFDYEMKNGILEVFTTADKNSICPVVSQEEFYKDLFELKNIIDSGPVKSFAFKRLEFLSSRFELHTILNTDLETLSQKSVPHRDFYNVRKVDTHVHHSACMNQKHLLRFIKHKLKNFANEIVIFRDGRFMTLKEVFKSLHLTAYDLSIDTLDMHASNTFHRFDRFNLKYNPAGQSRLREIFLKTDNLIAGRYLAEVTQEVIDDLRGSKYQLAEWRISIYGRKKSEWDKLARWFYVNKLAAPHIRWMIQIPRLYFLYKKSGECDNFEQMLNHIFLPLFSVTLNPSSNLPLHFFLLSVVGFDCVDDESKVEVFRAEIDKTLPKPQEWDTTYNPPYDYWCFYIQANLRQLNELRRRRGLNTFTFRPHSGEAGDTDHLAAAFLTANAINHGITLRKSVGLQYLYYLTQIGIAMSPLSNNKLFLDYHRNPFPTYFNQGLNVSLSTDDPLLLHYTKDALVEEYSVAAQVWKFTSTDICEIARNSVLQSGFEHRFKKHFLGNEYYLEGHLGNDIRMSNVPDIRLDYRHETLKYELNFIQKCKDN